MPTIPRRPSLASLGDRLRTERRDRAAGKPAAQDGFVRETYRLPRGEARLKAREFLDRYPKAAYWSAVESWRVTGETDHGEEIEFTMRRLRTAD